MTAKIFIDGEQGTTGLEIRERLTKLSGIQLLSIAEQQRKSAPAKAAVYAQADLVILCLPDQAAKVAAKLATETQTKVLDASTAHRTNADWVYGLPEFSAHRRAEIASAKKVSNPGCYASGCILGLKPLLQQGFLTANQQLTVLGVSGYSGGGKQLIQQYKQPPANFSLYALDAEHKHLKEIQHQLGLVHKPHFTPAVSNQFRGMLLVMPFFKAAMHHQPSLKDLVQCFKDYYANEPLICVHEPNQTASADGFLHLPQDPSDQLEIFCLGDETHLRIITRLDNLGKGACSVAIENLKLMLQL